MKLPSGSHVVRLKGTFSFEELKKHIGKDFNGYIAFTAWKERFIEGAVVIKSGKVVASHIEYFGKQEEKYSGEDAFSRLGDCFSSQYKVVDLFSIGKEQVEMILTFNASSTLKKARKIDELKKYFEVKEKKEKKEKITGQDKRVNIKRLLGSLGG